MREPWMEAEDREAEWDRKQKSMRHCKHCGNAIYSPTEDYEWKIGGYSYCDRCAKLLFRCLAPEV